MKNNFSKESSPIFLDTDYKINSYFKSLNNFTGFRSINMGIEEQPNLSTEDDSSALFSYSNLENNSQQLSTDENEDNILYNKPNFSREESENNRRKIFNVVYRENTPILNIQNESSSNDLSYLKKKRSKERRRRRENRDNILKKIKIDFFNNYMFKKINEVLKYEESKLYFQKFPISFVNDISKKINKEIINMTLLEIFKKKELCNGKYLDNYYHNLKVLKNGEVQENEELKKILNKKYCELYEDYLNSKEFRICQINRLKEKNMDDKYIEKYLYHAKYYIGFFSH